MNSDQKILPTSPVELRNVGFTCLHLARYRAAVGATLCIAALGALWLLSAPGTEGIPIHPGDDVQAVISSHPPGSTFVFKTGVHRLEQPIVARDGDTFMGEDGAILSGARQLTEFTTEGGLWVAANQTQENYAPHGSRCRSDAPRCYRPENLFFDDAPLKHVASKTDVEPGKWFFDYDADKIYFADDPTGRKIETSVTSGAVVGDANDVTFKGLTVEKFANPAQRGVIHAERNAAQISFGHNWHIEGNETRLNHGVGIKAGYGARILNNHVHNNGQLGIASYRGTGTLIEGNEIAYNNFAGFSDGWEAGGTKFTATNALVVRNNHVHHNDGPGLWTDGNNIDTLYEHNVVEYNTRQGIFHEISYQATIRHNIVRYNALEIGLERYAYVFGAGILIYSSSDVEVYGNTVVDNWNGINGLHHDRGTGAYGPWELKNLHVHNNHVEMLYHPDGYGPNGEPTGVAGRSGVSQAGGFNKVFSKEYNNRFENNAYTVDGRNARQFTWLNKNRDFETWQTCGGDDSLWEECRQDWAGEASERERELAHAR